MADPSTQFTGTYRGYRGYRRRPGLRPRSFGLVFSLLLIFGGVVLFLDSLDLVPLGNLWRFWPVVLIAVGCAGVSPAATATRRPYAVLLICAGVILQLAILHIIPVRAGTVFPLIAIGCGVLLLVDHLQRVDLAENTPPGSPQEFDFSPNVLHELTVFAGSKHRRETQQFEGGDLCTVFGNIEIDLRKATIAPSSGPMVVETSTVFGAIDLRVPETWIVDIQGLAVFGAYEDKTIPPRPAPGAESPRLVITGFVVFGAVNIGN